MAKSRACCPCGTIIKAHLQAKSCPQPRHRSSHPFCLQSHRPIVVVLSTTRQLVPPVQQQHVSAPHTATVRAAQTSTAPFSFLDNKHNTCTKSDMYHPCPAPSSCAEDHGARVQHWRQVARHSLTPTCAKLECNMPLTTLPRLRFPYCCPAQRWPLHVTSRTVTPPLHDTRTRLPPYDFPPYRMTPAKATE